MQIVQSINKNALIIATISFLSGTIVLLLFLITQSSIILDIGFFYVIIVFVLNAITFIGLVVNSIINYQYYKENLSTILLFSINIPVTIGYIAIVMSNPFLEYF